MVDILHSKPVEALGNESYAASMERSVDDFDVCMLCDSLRGESKRKDIPHIEFIHLLSHNLDSSEFFPFLKADLVRIGNGIDLGDDVLIDRGGYLTSVAPEYFVSIVFFGIMTGSNHDSRRGFLGANAIA